MTATEPVTKKAIIDVDFSVIFLNDYGYLWLINNVRLNNQTNKKPKNKNLIKLLNRMVIFFYQNP